MRGKMSRYVGGAAASLRAFKGFLLPSASLAFGTYKSST